MKKRELLILFIVLCAVAISRVLLPWNNFSPIGAIALVGGAFIGKKWLAFALPLFSLFISDLVLSQISPIYSSYLFSSTFLSVYIAFALIVVFGILISKKLKLVNILGMGLVATAAFFLITNFGSWLYFGMYPMNAGGLMTAYAAGIPFLQNSLVSQLLFSAVLYAGLQWSFNRKLVIA